MERRQQEENVTLNRDDKMEMSRMETRRIRTPSAKMLAARQEDGFLIGTVAKSQSTTNTTEKFSEPIAPETASISETLDKPVKEVSSPVIKETTPVADEIDITENDRTLDVGLDVENICVKMEPGMIDDVGAEVTVESNRFLKLPKKRVTNFTGETLSLKHSDLSIPNKAAHFLYFRCYDEAEVQKEFPLTIDCTKHGPQNFLVEPRVGLRSTDYYIDNYLWNRGKSTSSKKRIFVEVDGNHVKTSRKCMDTAPYILNWYYSNMENRMSKKVCWLETCPDGVRASPVLVQYHVYDHTVPIDVRRTPKLYSDTREVAQELLRSDSPIHTVARFLETGETDPREIINKKQAYEMRRFMVSSARRKMRSKREPMLDGEGNPIFYDEPNNDMYEESVYYDEHGVPQSTPSKIREMSEASRIANNAIRMVSRKLESRISALLDAKLGLCPTKLCTVRVPILTNPDLQAQADQLAEWINALASSSHDDVDIVIHTVVNSMRKQLDEVLIAAEAGEFIDESGSSQGHKRRIETIEDTNESKRGRFDDPGNQDYIFDNQEYVEEVIAEVIDGTEGSEPTSSSRNRQPQQYFYQASRGDIENDNAVNQSGIPQDE